MRHFNAMTSWLFCLTTLSCSSLLFADTSILSTAYGLGAINWIANDPDLRNSIALREDQLTKIQKILSQSRLLFTGDESSNNLIAKQHLANILTTEQASLLRIQLVRTRIVTPANFFNPPILSELGVDNDAALRIHQTFARKQAMIFEGADRLRVKAIKDALPPNAQEVVWKYIGRDFLIEVQNAAPERIQLFREIEPSFELSVAPYATIPSKLELSIEQREQLTKFGVEVSKNTTDGHKYVREELEQKLNALLTKPQRFAIQQAIHQFAVRRNLLTVVNPGIAKQFELSDDNLSEARTKLSESKREIEEAEQEELIQTCKEVLTDVPLPTRTLIKELSADVWAL